MQRSFLIPLFLGMLPFGLPGEEDLGDPFSDDSLKRNAELDAAPDTWEVTCEIFSLPLNEAADLRRQNSDSARMYQEILQRVEKGTAVLKDFAVLKTSMGGEVKTHSLEEYIYPTEYDPAELPNSVGNVGPEHDTSGVSTPSNPTSYDQRGLGTTMEIEFQRKQSPESIRVSVEVGRSFLKARDTWGKERSEAVVPQFGSHGIKRSVNLKTGQPVLAGSMSPPRRLNAKDRRVWLLFVTGVPVPSEKELKEMKGAAWDVIYEVYSMPRSQAVALKRGGRSDRELVDLVNRGKLALEQFFTLRMEDGQKTLLKEATEMTYATEFDPPELPNSVNSLSTRPGVVEEISTEANPTSYEKKDVGSLLLLNLSRGKAGDLSLSSDLEFVRYLGRVKWGQGKSEAEMPRFTSQKLFSRIDVKTGEPVVLGSVSPPEPLQPKVGERQVWFAIVTILEARN